MKAIISLLLAFFICIGASDVFAESNEEFVDFNFIEFDKVLDSGNISKAESVYQEWIKKRQTMLDNGSKFGLLDMVIKHKYALIKFHKKEYSDVIAIEDEVLNYLQKNINDENDKNLEWSDRIWKSMLYKVFSYYEAGDYQRSLKVRQDMLNFVEAKDTSNKMLTLSAFNELAKFYCATNNFDDSIVFYKECVNLFAQTYGWNTRGTLMFINKVAEVECNKGNFTEAAEILEIAYPVATELLNKYEQISFMNTLAAAYNGIARFKEALNLKFQILLKVTEVYGEESDAKINSLIDIASIFKNVGNYSEALKYSQEGFYLANKIYGMSDRMTLDAMLNLLSIYPFLNKFDEQGSLALEGLKISQNLYGEDHLITLSFLHALSSYYTYLGDADKVKEISYYGYNLTKNLHGDAFERLNAQFTTGVANAHYVSGEYEISLKWQKEVVKKGKKLDGDKTFGVATQLALLADNYIRVKDYKSAIEAGKEAIEIYEQNLEQNNKIHGFTLAALEYTAKAYSLDGQEEKAVEYYSKYIDTCEHLRNQYDNLSTEDKTQWFSGKTEVYKDAMYVFLQERSANKKSFITAELCKARSLADRYLENLSNVTMSFKAEDMDKIRVYQTKINEYSQQIKNAIVVNDIGTRINLEHEQTQVINAYRDFKNELQEKYPKYKSFRTMQEFDLFNDLTLLPEDTCYINFINCKGNIVVFAVKGHVWNCGCLVPATDSKEFLKKCKLYHDLLAHQNIEHMRAENQYLWKLSNGSYEITIGRKSPSSDAKVVHNEEFLALRDNLSTELGEIVLKPLKNYLDSENWVISPDGELNDIPFETLRYNDKLAVESANISYVPSFMIFKLMHQHHIENNKLHDRKELFAMGDAVYNDTDTATSRGTQLEFFNKLRSNPDEEIGLTSLRWSNLPGTARELNKVSSLFENKEVLRREQVTEKNLRQLNSNGELSKYKYLLFATHGIFVPEKPEISSIVLSQQFNDEDNDGYVTVGEWMGYDLRSNLVYLSACESGLGGYQEGEGIVGIPYALTVAGNKDTVMSLWKVDDEATAEFTASVFEKLSKGKSEVVALNETKREFLKNDNPKYRNPSVWAAFLLYGI